MHPRGRVMDFEVVSFAIIGVLTGFLSGLIGIGGGIIMIPCLLLVFNYIDIPPQNYMHLAIGTSLAAMVFNTLSASYSHYRKKAVFFHIIKPMSIGIVLGAFIGVSITRVLSSQFLQVFFGVFECLLGLHFFWPNKKAMKKKPLPKFWSLSAIAFSVSTLSIILGIGGGLLNVPILNYFHVPVKKAIGTSSALSFLTSCFGVASFLLIGKNTPKTPENIGFFYIPAFIIISIGSFFAAPYGVKLAHHLPTKNLKKVFGSILLIAGLSMIF